MEVLFSFLKTFDFDKMLPNIGVYAAGLKFWAWVLLMVAPVLLFLLGTRYTKNPPSDPNCFWAYANKKIQNDRELWEKVHKIAGKSWTALGAILSVVGLVCGVLFLIVNALAATTIAAWVIVIELVLILCSKSAINKKLNK